MTELAQVLEKTFSQDIKDQQFALNLLQQAAESNFAEYVKQLSTVLSNRTLSTFIRKAAGIQLKNTLTGREQSSFDKNKERWLNLPVEVRDYVKKCVLQTLGTEMRPSTAAQCVAAIACIELPIKQWPELVDCLSANVVNDSGDPMVKESSLEALGYICQDVRNLPNTAPITAIVHGLRTDEGSVHVRLAATKALSEIVDWIVTRTLEEHVDAIVDVICAYLQTAEINLYEEAAKCLYKIASRKCAKSTETPIVLSLFRDEPIRQILTAAKAADDYSSSLEHYKYLKALCDLLCALGIHLADVWAGYVMKPPPNFSLYLSALFAFFKHPSIYIRAETAQVLATFCGHERISKNEDFINLVPQLIEFLPKAMGKSCSPIPSQDLTVQYSRMDYENEIEMQREYIRLRDHCLRLIRESAADHFDKLLIVSQNWILKRCIVFPTEINNDEWELMKRFITAVIQASFQLELATVEVRQEYQKLFDAVLQCSTDILNASASNLLNGVLSILSALYPVFDDFPDRIPYTLNHLKAILLVENHNNLDIEVTATKRHSIALILKIVAMFPKSVKPYAKIVFDLVAEVGDRVSMMQRANLVHVLAALSNLAENVDEQTEFLCKAIRHDVQYIQTEQFSTSPLTFLNQSGLTTMPDSMAISNQNCPYYQGRLNLKASLTALEGVLNQVNVPDDEQASLKIFALFVNIVPKFFQFAMSLNSIYMPEYSSMINPFYGPSVLEMAPSERQTIISSIAMMDTENDLNGKKQSDEYEPGQSMAIGNSDMVLFMRKFISEISDLVQNIIGLFFARFPNNIYAIPNISEMLNATLYAIELVPNFRLRFWVRKTWSRAAIFCPPQHSNSILSFLSALTTHLQKRLIEQWALILKQRESTEADEEPTEEELIAESTMSLLSRECAFFMVNFILGETFSLKNVRKDAPIPMTPIATKLLNDRNFFLAAIGLLSKLITCPDSQAAIKCIPAVNVLIFNCNAIIDEQTAIDLFVHGIRSLQMFSNDELAAGPILTIIFNIYAQLRPKYPSLLEVLKQVPNCLQENIESFDQRIISMSNGDDGKMHDKIKRDLMRKVLTSTKSKAHYRKTSSGLNGIDADRVME